MRYGIIGEGGISKVHKESIALVGGVIGGVCDIDVNKPVANPQDKCVYDKMFSYYRDYHALLASHNVDVVVICTPNYLHYPMVVDALEREKKVICEKPHALSETEMGRILRGDTGKRLYPVLQLRYNPFLREQWTKYSRGFHEVEMVIAIHRDKAYFDGWKGKQMMSGGLLFNIGIHYFDFLRWFFGEHKGQSMTSYHWKNSQGVLLLERAVVRWHLDIETPKDQQRRIVKIDGEEINLSYNFQNLHQEIYKEVESGVPSSVVDIQGTYALIEKLMQGR